MIHRALLLALLGLSLSFHGLAQDRFETYYTAGPMLKLVQSRFSFSSSLVNVPEAEPEVGYQIGGFFRARVNDLYVQTELLLSNTQNQLVFNNFGGTPGFNPRAEFEFTSFEIPLVIGYFWENLRLETGPGISVLMKGNQFFMNTREDVTENFNKVSLTYRFGLGLDINDVLVNLSYEFGLSKTGESLRRLVGTNVQPKRTQVALSVALILFRHKRRL